MMYLNIYDKLSIYYGCTFHIASTVCRGAVVKGVEHISAIVLVNI